MKNVDKEKQMTLQLLPANEIDFTDFLDAFNLSYSDYMVPVQLDDATMRSLITRDAVDMQASQVAILDDEVVGVGMLAIRNQIGWVGGLGVIPKARGRGYGRQIMDGLLDEARHRQLSLVELEVIEGNEAAYQLYLKLGFEVRRKLLIFECKSIQNAVDTIGVESVGASEALHHFDALHTVAVPWQRHLPALMTLADYMQSFIVRGSGQVSAYGVGWVTPETIRWMDMAGSPDALKAIISYAHQQEPAATGSYINVGEDDPTVGVLQTMGYQISLAQIEMEIRL